MKLREPPPKKKSRRGWIWFALFVVVVGGWLIILYRDNKLGDVRRMFASEEAAAAADADAGAVATAVPVPMGLEPQEQFAPEIAHELDASTFVVVADDPPEPSPAAATSVDAGALYAFGDPKYTEPDCETLSDVTAIAAAHKPGAAGMRASAMALTKARYPSGTRFIEAQEDRLLMAWFTGVADSFEGVSSRIETVVHEGSHIWLAKKFNARTSTYSVRGDLTIEAKLLKNFNRSEIAANHVDAKGDSYLHVYLEGSSGAQGFNTLLDEYNAYCHTLAARYCTRDLVKPNIRMSTRDGILTMMYYVETYLELARTKHAADYAAILADAGHRKLILTVWDRSEFWLRKSASIRALGIADEKIAKWVYDPNRLKEIARIRDTAAH